MYPYSMRSSLLPRCADAPQVEVPNLHYLVNILMKSTVRKMRLQKLVQDLGDLSQFPFCCLFSFVLQSAPGACAYVRLFAHIYGDENNQEKENGLKYQRTVTFLSSGGKKKSF